MKKTLICATLLATLSIAVTSCQKENIAEPERFATEKNAGETVYYTVGGIRFSQTINSEDEYDTLLMRLIMLSKEGYEVSFFGNRYSSASGMTKDTVTYTTTNENDAVAWMKQKINEGYTVTITYDEGTGIFTCIAVK